MATKMAAACWFALVDTLTLSFITRLLPDLIYGLSSMFEYRFCLMNNNQEGNQNVHPPVGLAFVHTHFSPNFIQILYRCITFVNQIKQKIGQDKHKF